MKCIAILALFICSHISYSQNVGIGATLPVNKLHVHDGGAVNTNMSLTNSGTGITANDGLLIGMQGTSGIVTNLENGNLRLGTNNLTRLMIDAAGNVGIGNLSPNNKLDVTGAFNVNGSMKLEGLGLFEFGAGVAGKEINAGKIGYNAFGTNALAFVGAGTSSSNRAVYFFAEGGTTFTGPINVFTNANINGQLQMGGDPGTSGQVLTSTGAANPEWKAAAFGNTTRFAVRFYENVSGAGSGSLPLTMQYNLNPTDISVGATSITINKTGLYHFDYYLHYSGASTTQPVIIMGLFGAYPASTILFLKDEVVVHTSASTIYKGNWHFTLDVHITAPATLSLSRNFLNVTSFSIAEGDFLGHLVNQ